MLTVDSYFSITEYNFVEHLTNVSKKCQNQILAKYLDKLCKLNNRPSGSALTDYNMDVTSRSRMQTPQTGVCTQLAYYPQNRDGTPRENPRIANYSRMEYAGGRSMAFENNRLESFHSWPENKSFIKPSDLAKAGFYHDCIDHEHPDRVKCTFCRGVLHSWELGDEPIKEHRRGFPTCPFVLSLDVGNVPTVGSGSVPDRYLSSIDESQNKPKHSHLPVNSSYCSGTLTKRCDRKFLLYKNRLWSYSSFQNISNSMMQLLSSNGLFYTGRDNVIQCFKCNFYCRIEHKNPTEAHKNNHPTCPYLKGQERRKIEQTIQAGSNSVIFHMTPRLKDSDVQTRMDSWAFRQALALGFDVAVVKFVVLKYIHFDGENVLTLSKLIDDIKLLEDSMRSYNINMDNTERSINEWKDFIAAKEELWRSQMKKETDRLQHMVENDPNILKSYCDDPQFKDKIQQMSADDRQCQELINEYLKSEQYCKICMDQTVDVVFIPCHHILSCQDCTDNMRVCPACRSPIETTIQATYDMS